MDETWFLLFNGTSVDGTGYPQYVGRTTDAKVAKKHHESCKSPYSTGYVLIVTDKIHQKSNSLDDIAWENL